jgi:hypothetical protein
VTLGTAARRTAWEAYVALTTGLLPVLDRVSWDHRDVGARLAKLAKRIRRGARLWGQDGQMLASAIASAVQLHCHGQLTELAGLLRVVAYRLFLLACGEAPPDHAPARP